MNLRYKVYVQGGFLRITMDILVYSSNKISGSKTDDYIPILRVGWVNK